MAAVLSSAYDLHMKVEEIKPDVILIQTDSPSRDTLENMAAMDREMPRPVVVFANDSDSKTIRRAMKAGVSAYVVDGLEPKRIKPVIDVALARFEEHQELRRSRDEARQKLSERISIDRAKGILMKLRGIDEDAAYHTLRKLAMERGKTIAAVSEDFIATARLLG
ncbi:MAG: ANTAR domain-containing protein [Methyloversatilis sp.]|uniref:ANTAR domain-containing response regulator n=1 Tax=Methyloversatilis sp. TaxID=2569862 RepID=UPI0025F22F0A|nr:ANTAR domain-containing protein [Methyloversatilis sp.]MCR6667289.1 ANTAR domain-containing protein [Methyloversatilis sp.]